MYNQEKKPRRFATTAAEANAICPVCERRIGETALFYDVSPPGDQGVLAHATSWDQVEEEARGRCME